MAGGESVYGDEHSDLTSKEREQLDRLVAALVELIERGIPRASVRSVDLELEIEARGTGRTGDGAHQERGSRCVARVPRTTPEAFAGLLGLDVALRGTDGFSRRGASAPSSKGIREGSGLRRGQRGGHA